MKKNRILESIAYGLIAAIGLLFLYFIVMTLGSGSFDFAFKELVRLRYWTMPLLTGFGIQIGLFAYLRSCAKMGMMEKGSTAASAATSTTAMVACCAHHITDILPLIGLSILSTFLVKYQEWFLAIGIISNIIGISLMAKQILKMKSANRRTETK